MLLDPQAVCEMLFHTCFDSGSAMPNPPLPPMRHLRVFEGAARLGGFSAAAEELHTTQSAVSRTVAALDTHEFAVGRMPGTQAGGIDGPGLSMRERECLLWTLEGKTAKEIATILGLSVFTVNHHAFNATRKLGSLNKHHAAIQAFRAGLI